MPLGKNRKTVALDFDGVVHRYSKGYHDGTAYDDPMPGALEAIKHLMKKYCVCIFTTRDLVMVQDWFSRYTMIRTHIMKPEEQYWTLPGAIGLANHKVVAFVYVDDRGLRFEGDWDETITDLEEILEARK